MLGGEDDEVDVRGFPEAPFPYRSIRQGINSYLQPPSGALSVTQAPFPNRWELFGENERPFQTTALPFVQAVSLVRILGPHVGNLGNIGYTKM